MVFFGFLIVKIFRGDAPGPRKEFPSSLLPGIPVKSAAGSTPATDKPPQEKTPKSLTNSDKIRHILIPNQIQKVIKQVSCKIGTINNLIFTNFVIKITQYIPLLEDLKPNNRLAAKNKQKLSLTIAKEIVFPVCFL